MNFLCFLLYLTDSISRLCFYKLINVLQIPAIAFDDVYAVKYLRVISASTKSAQRN